MSISELYNIGLSEQEEKIAAENEDCHIGRIVGQYKDMYRALSAEGELNAEISGKMRFEARNPADYPAVGDFVLLDRSSDAAGNAIITGILPRRSLFVRRAAGSGQEMQLIASNVDTVFICMALNQDFNPRRLERYLAIAWESLATPVVVLTKADLCADLAGRLVQAYEAAIGVDIVTVSSLEEGGYEAVRPYLGPGRTVALVGSSGVGKSTLINRLLGRKLQATREIRQDDGRGRHATTVRQLLSLPGGGAVIDTPGMRELGLESADLGRTFADIEDYGRGCRFRDCAHENEPGCAVREAIAAGLLAAERLESYKKLRKELKYEGLNSRQLEEEKIRSMFGSMTEMKNVMRQAKKKNRRQGR